MTVAAAAFAGFSQPGCAATQGSSALGSASATVVAPLTVVPLADLDFGWIAASGPGSGTATIRPYDTVVDFTGSAQPACTAAASCSAPHAARFAVTGEADRTYVVKVPDTVMVVGSGSGIPLVITKLVLRAREAAVAGMTGRLDDRGEGEFAIGGTLVVSPATAAGHYRTTLPVIVTYG